MSPPIAAAWPLSPGPRLHEGLSLRLRGCAGVGAGSPGGCGLLPLLRRLRAMVSWKGIYFLLALFLASFFGSIFMLSPFLPLMFVSPAWYRWITDRIVATWLTLPVALLEIVFGAKVVITGDGFIPGERSVIIMNHRTRMDWMFLWNCLLRYSYLRLEKICLKSSLKSVPGFANTKARSNEFAEKNGLRKYKYVLHPRTTGFTFVVERLREGNNLDAIHDITVAYPQNIPQTEKHLLNGNFPKEIHFHVHRYPVQTLPTSREELQLWCQKRWEEKEERLQLFYEGEKYFDVTGRSIIPPCKSELRVLVVKCISLLYWTLFTLAMFVLLYLYSFVRWYCVTAVVIFVVQQKIFGGLEIIELARHRYFNKRQNGYGRKTE
ncbi:lysocardiolipin acyltransferase 1 isoform X3 [Trachemys scripta elegans]|uniref:lysocardiolipin acyltransferase 1 isoform X3 n=1 Tax=Trachemys scripta elegans TaxID=31138 RepID=UPI001557F1D7|nr:lysocardiolipin acyltransferase 1 isoform X3 [Trachemys scripta elegans]